VKKRSRLFIDPIHSQDFRRWARRNKDLYSSRISKCRSFINTGERP